MLTLVGCSEYRVEYRRLPSYYAQAADREIPEREMLADGTVVVYKPSRAEERARRARGEGGDDEGNPSGPKLRDEKDDGTVILRPRDPEDVLRLLLQCLHNEEYYLIYDQLFSTPSRKHWEEQGRTDDDFASYFLRNRRELARTVQRLLFGLGRNETYTVRLDHNVLEYQLNPQIADGMKFRRVRILIEPEGSRLVLIR